MLSHLAYQSVLSSFSFFSLLACPLCFSFFFFNDTATTEIYPLSLHDALPIFEPVRRIEGGIVTERLHEVPRPDVPPTAQDRKSTRLNSSHLVISYAVFCLKKKKIHYGKDLLPIPHRSTLPSGILATDTALSAT